jgi:hypothetical protein
MIPGQSQQFFEAAAAQAAGGGYEIERSLRFNSADSAYLDRTPSAEGNRKTWTWSGWVKKAGLGTQSFLFASIPSNLDNYVQIYFSTDQLVINTKTSGNAFTSTKTAGLFRDPSAWYHLVVAIDTTATSNSGKDRLKIYINGRLLGDSDYQSDGRASIALNSDLRINSTNAHHIGKQGEYSGTYANVYLAEVHFIDGQALAATDFGEFDSNSVWQPKEFAGSYTTSGVSFDFAEQQLYAGGTREALFDGSTSTYCSFQRTTGSSGDPSNTKRIKVTFPTAKTGVTKLRIYGGGNLSSTNKVWYNDDESTMIDNDDPVDWKTVYSGSAITINSISFGTSVGGSNLRAIEINDVVLTDAIEYGLNSFHLDFSDNSSSAALGTDSSGNNNDWTVNNLTAAGLDMNQSQTWSTYGSASSGGAASGLGLERGFNGDVTNQTEGDTTGAYFSIPFSTTIASGDVGFVSYASGGSGHMKLYNGSTEVDDVTSSGNSQFRYSTYVGAITEIRISRDGRAFEFAAVSVFGEVLVDAGVLDPTLKNIDSLIDTPTNYTAASGNNGGNYATFNPLDNGGVDLSNGNLDVSNGEAHEAVRSTIKLPASGKYYVEFTQNSFSGETIIAFGIDYSGATTPPNWSAADKIYLGLNTTTKYIRRSGTALQTLPGSPAASGNVIQVAYDADNEKLWLGLDNTWYDSSGGTTGNPSTGANATESSLAPGFLLCNAYNATGSLNAGQRPFAYTPPTGFLSLCTTNLPNPTIADGSTYFTAVKYAGNSGDGLPTTQDIVTTFSPDLVWIKDRSGTNSHHLFDIIRGAGKRIFSNSTAAETNVISTLSAFNSDGFTVNGNNAVNDVGSNYISWCWDAGTSNATISAGSLNSSAYDQSQTWSDSLTASSGLSGATNAFDGDLSTRAQSSAGTNQTLTFAPSTGVSFTSTLEVYCDQGDSTPTASWNGNTVNPGGGAWVTVFTGSGTINATYPLVIDTQSASQFATLKGVRLDGKILVDSGVTPPNVPLIASTVRANPSAGFSIVSYQGDGSTSSPSVGHGLNAVPGLVIIKNRDGSQTYPDWYVKHKDIGDNYNIRLNLTSGRELATGIGAWYQGGIGNLTSSSVITFVTGSQNSTGNVNSNGINYIAYCFAPVEGFSAFGSYTGNGSTDGPFIFTGFKVRWLMYKRTDAANSWQILDTERDPANVNNLVLIADLANAESTGTGNNDQFDMLSNGFKVRSSNFAGNASGGTYIYAAFAENPFKTARAR